jgi:hypothetical protein
MEHTVSIGKYSYNFRDETCGLKCLNKNASILGSGRIVVSYRTQTIERAGTGSIT